MAHRHGLGALAAGGLVLALAGCGAPADPVESRAQARVAQAEELHSFYSRLSDCMNDKGLAVTVNAQGDGIHIDTTNSSAGAEDLDLIYDTCAESVGGPPPRPEPPSTEEIRALYGLYAETYDCLVAHGHPAVEPPSQDVYVSTYEASLAGVGSAPWRAYDLQNDDALEATRQDCPEPTLADIGA